MKRYAPFLALILCIGIFLAYFIISGNKDSNGKSELPTYTYVDQSDVSKIRVFSVSKEDLKISLTYSSESGWCLGQNSLVPVSESFATSLLDDFSVIVATKKIENPESDLSQYGLDNPFCSIRIRSVGTEKNYYFGNYLKQYDSYYFKTDESDLVYLVPSNYVSALDFSVTDILYIKKLPALDSMVSVKFTDNSQSSVTFNTENATNGQTRLANALSSLSISHAVSYGKDNFSKFHIGDAGAVISYKDGNEEKEIVFKLGIDDSGSILYMIAPDTSIICVVECDDPSAIAAALNNLKQL